MIKVSTNLQRSKAYSVEQLMKMRPEALNQLVKSDKHVAWLVLKDSFLRGIKLPEGTNSISVFDGEVEGKNVAINALSHKEVALKTLGVKEIREYKLSSEDSPSYDDKTIAEAVLELYPEAGLKIVQDLDICQITVADIGPSGPRRSIAFNAVMNSIEAAEYVIKHRAKFVGFMRSHDGHTTLLGRALEELQKDRLNRIGDLLRDVNNLRPAKIGKASKLLRRIEIEAAEMRHILA